VIRGKHSLIVGTAGHIDHGKSALVLALTGTDPDRLKEEKERGITIDLGFAHLDLGDGLTVSFVDVPGHERFVRNMLAGAHGIDAVALVVAADESVMPQTREHFQICRLLGIPRGLVVLTKCDVADAESQALAELEVLELVAGSFLEGRPVLRVSAPTGFGLDALREALRVLASEAPPRPSDGVLRLPVDRAFSLRGFGTVVTGALVSGALSVGEEVEVLPAGRRARVRGLQIHGQPTDRAVAGSRTAVNLAGVDVADLARGDVLVRPGTMRPTAMIDVELTLLPGEKPLLEGARVRVHLASAEVLARVRLLGARRVDPGAVAIAQLRLERPAVAGWGERIVLRAYSPAATIGGARVLDPLPPKRRRADLSAVERLRDASDPGAAAAAMVAEAGASGVDGPTLAARLTIPLAALRQRLESDASLMALGQEPIRFLSREAVEALGDAARRFLDRFHREQPLRAAMPREELRRRAFAQAPPAAFEHVLASLAAAGEVRLLPDAVARLGHTVSLSPGEEGARGRLAEAALAAGLAGIDPHELAARTGQDPKLFERVSRVLLADHVLDRVGEGPLVHREHLEKLKAVVRARWPGGARLDVAAFKEMTGLSRKFVIPLLEYLDRERVTRRAGTDRFVIG
jgi:selenocysteine-specific elongation factor